MQNVKTSAARCGLLLRHTHLIHYAASFVVTSSVHVASGNGFGAGGRSRRVDCGHGHRHVCVYRVYWP